MRLIGIFLIGISVAIYGFFITYRLINSTKQLSKIIILIDTIKQKMRFNKERVKDLILYFQQKDYSFLFLDNNFESLDMYFNSICFENKLLYLNSDQKHILNDFFLGLGKTDLKGQISHCENYKKIFENELLKTEEQNSKKIKLYPSLFILGGLLIILILF